MILIALGAAVDAYRVIWTEAQYLDISTPRLAWFDDSLQPVPGVRAMGYAICPDHDRIYLHKVLLHNLARLHWTVAHEVKHVQLHRSGAIRCADPPQAREEDLCDAHADSRYPAWGSRRVSVHGRPSAA